MASKLPRPYKKRQRVERLQKNEHMNEGRWDAGVIPYADLDDFSLYYEEPVTDNVIKPVVGFVPSTNDNWD